MKTRLPRQAVNKKSKMPKLSTLVILANLILLGFIIFAVASIFLGVDGKRLKSLFPAPKPSPTLSPTVRPSPTPVPLVQGPQTYSISQKDATPVMYEVWFSTIDPKKGGNQSANLKVKDEKADITKASAKIQTENKSFEKSLTLSSGNARDGVWSGSWQVNDSYDKKFMITFMAEDSVGNKASIDMTIR